MPIDVRNQSGILAELRPTRSAISTWQLNDAAPQPPGAAFANTMTYEVGRRS